MVELNKPEKIYKVGVLSLSVWENEGTEKNFKSFTFQKSFINEEGDWQQTQKLNLSDLPKLRVLIDEAYRDQILKED